MTWYGRVSTGQTFGQLTVLRRIENNKWGTARYLCRCAGCGREDVEVPSSRLTRTRYPSRSCKDCQRKTVVQSATKHGHTKGGKCSPEYRSIIGAKGRCFNKRNKNYADYGGRLKIPMADRYRRGEGGKAGVECLIADIGKCPPGYTLGRIDNNLGYIVGNIEWQTKSQQANNRRCNVVVTIGGRKLTKAQWAREAGWAPKNLNNLIVSINKLLARTGRNLLALQDNLKG
jgi:hypothetical protein